MTDRSETLEPDVTEGGDEVDELGRGEGDDETEHDAPDDTGHLGDIEDGAGCTEIWERLSERREG
jgi:hypothetical protein